MATGNFFLGTGRKSVGDVTFYRSRGQQRARVRVREVANPRSYMQLLQRAVIANVAQLYSRGIEIFNHSFQGYAPGLDNQLRFQKVNAARLRALLAADYNEQREDADCQGRIGARGLKVCVPFDGLQVSEGSYEQNVFEYTEGKFNLPVVQIDTTVGQYAADNGLVDGDIFTFLGFSNEYDDDSVAEFGEGDYSRLLGSYMVYLQLMVKEGTQGSTTTLTNGDLLTKVFDLKGDRWAVDNAGSLDFDEPSIESETLFGQRKLGGIACIRSRYDSDLRSTSYLMPSDPTNGMKYGLTINYLEAAWGDGSAVERPTRILSGVNFI